MQALSLRLFGFHIWALVLPQVIEGVLTVLVLPGLAAAYLLAGPAERWRTRIGHVAAAGAVTVLAPCPG